MPTGDRPEQTGDGHHAPLGEHPMLASPSKNEARRFMET